VPEDLKFNIQKLIFYVKFLIRVYLPFGPEAVGQKEKAALKVAVSEIAFKGLKKLNPFLQ
jgi:hypothetical protein